MTLPSEFVSGGKRLEPGEFYISRIGQVYAPLHLPVAMSRFVAKFHAFFDAELPVPKRLDLAVFKDVAKHIHILAFDPTTETWTFEIFAPAYAARLGLDLTGADVEDPRFHPYNLKLDEKLARLLAERSPFYVGTRVDELGGERISHRLFVPMSNIGSVITHCLMMSV